MTTRVDSGWLRALAAVVVTVGVGCGTTACGNSAPPPQVAQSSTAAVTPARASQGTSALTAATQTTTAVAAASGATSTVPKASQLPPPPPPWSDDADFTDVPGSLEPHQVLAKACPPPATTVTQNAVATSGPIPLREGLQWVNAWHRFNGDVEQDMRLASIDHGDLVVAWSGLAFDHDDSVEGKEGSGRRRICQADVASGPAYITEFRGSLPEILPGSTTFQLSARAFQEVSTSGRTHWLSRTYLKAFYSDRLVPVDRSGELQRVEPTTVPWGLIINGQRVEVPTIHLKGTLTFEGLPKVKALLRDPAVWSQDAEVYVLNDPANPMCLRYSIGPIFRIQVVSVTLPQEKPVNTIAAQLEKERRAVVYGIYFDFNKDTIRPTSEPVLAEIAAALKEHPDWHLKVEGHTDNIGGDAYNLTLSQRRAASVKRALVEHYQIADGRLTPAGFGASRPVDTNETLEGRARNRRVELSRD